ncbi:MAG: cytochrome ubiquinol oxidase subunit I [Acidobacteriota bacterium]
MDSLLGLHRLHFAFTVTFHYIFPQLTMGLALLIFILKTMALKSGDEVQYRAARFWIRIFAIGFAFGVVTGIPMEFQFGANWARFAKAAGGVIGQTLAMEGVFSFFLESTLLGLLVFGEKRLGPRGHWAVSLLMLTGTWLSAFFIVATNAWMQHPVGYRLGPGGEILLDSLGAVLTNPWLVWMFLHTVTGSVVTASFVMTALGALYLLSDRFEPYARLFVRLGVIAGCAASILMLFPTGDYQGKMVAHRQPVTLAAMEGLFETTETAPLAILGQPDVERRRLDNPLLIPRMLSFLTYQRWRAEVKGLDAFPRENWPDQIPLLYYSYHIMAGLGTIFIAVTLKSVWLLWKGRLYRSRPWLWVLLLLLPFPFIANTFGWMTAELGRQPWLIYGLMRTSEGVSAHVSAGNALFTLLGFLGLYAALSMLFLFLMYRELDHGPEPAAP